jgi:L-lactate utilization protein LutC
MSYAELASPDTVKKTIEALSKNGITAELVDTAAQAKEKVLSLIPAGSEVMTMTSISLDQTGLTEALNEVGKFKSVKNELASMNRETQADQMQKLGAAPQWAVGSVHAVTEDGKVIVASNTGSQLPAYAYGSSHVIWVVSTKKIVRDINDGFNRIDEHIIPLESVRARKAYGLPDTWDTFPSKLLIVNREVNPNRIKVIFVNEDLGF